MQQFLLDANVFVAATRNPEKKAGSLDLILNSYLIRKSAL